MAQPQRTTTVRHALHHDLAGAADVLAQAFVADPWFRWLYPDDATWTQQATAWFHFVLDRAFSKGHTYVADGGAVNWIPPDVHFPEPDDVALAVGLLGTQIGDRAATAFDAIGRAGATFPDRPRFHCVYVGVRPDAQGRGLGSTLLRRVLDACDRDGLAASLTSTNDANLPLYHSLGFREIGEVPIPGTGRSMRPMWREPLPVT
jgi:ribosomal protein S18 acetylase RimI-like enzyme